MLEPGLCQPDLARPPQVATAHTLRERALDPGRFGILLLEFGSLLTGTCRLYRFMLVPWANCATTCPRLGFRPRRPARTRTTVFGIAGDMAAGIAFPQMGAIAAE